MHNGAPRAVPIASASSQVKCAWRVCVRAPTSLDADITIVCVNVVVKKRAFKGGSLKLNDREAFRLVLQ